MAFAARKLSDDPILRVTFNVPIVLAVLAVGTQPILPIGLKRIARQLRVSIAPFGIIAAAVDVAQHAIAEGQT